MTNHEVAVVFIGLVFAVLAWGWVRLAERKGPRP